jgi:hypothetical protein
MIIILLFDESTDNCGHRRIRNDFCVWNRTLILYIALTTTGVKEYVPFAKEGNTRINNY